jgi:hypothetical protein
LESPIQSVPCISSRDSKLVMLNDEAIYYTYVFKRLP